MNKSYRIVWNHARNCLMVVSEATKSRGKSGGAKAAVVAAVASVIMALGSEAIATDYVIPTSPSGYTYDNTLQLNSSDSLDIANGGSVGGAVSIGVSVAGATISAATGVSINVSSGGTISAQEVGLLAGGGSTLQGAINNQGLISTAGLLLTQSYSGWFGVNLQDASVPSINNGGTISVEGGAGFVSHLKAAGIQVSSSVAGLAVSGNIVNDTQGLIVGSYFGPGQTPGSLVSGTLSGIALVGASVGGNIENRGTISLGQVTAPFMAMGVELKSSSISGALINTGSINAAAGFYVTNSSIGNGVVNSGTLVGATTGARNFAIYLNLASISGGITNSGRIDNARSGGIQLYNSTLTGGITNAGTISSRRDGINLALSDASGWIKNVGRIEISRRDGIGIYDSTLTGGILNAGEITATGVDISYGIKVDLAAVTQGITNNGSIVIESTDNRAYGLAFESSTINGGVANTGLISVAGSGAIGVGFYNTTMAGGVTNGGTIIGSGIGLEVYSNATISGGLTNSGTIRGGATGVLVGYSSALIGGITNQGLIEAGEYAIAVYTSVIDGGIRNGSGGTISGGTGGIYIDSYSTVTGNRGIFLSSSSLAGGINNAGSIAGTGGAGILASHANIAGGVTNTGTISGNNFGVRFHAVTTVTGGFSNEGLITASGSGSSAAGIRISSYTSLAGGLTNSGTIQGYRGLLVDGATLENGINNRGALVGAGSSQSAFGLHAKLSNVNGGITNSGIIADNANNRAIYIQQSIVTGSLLNTISGTSVGTIQGSWVGVYLDASTVTGDIINSGLITATGDAAISLFNASVGGAIFNEAGATIQTAANAPAIRVGVTYTNASYQPSTIAGGIQNSGLIQSVGESIDIVGSSIGGDIVNSVSGTMVGGLRIRGANLYNHSTGPIFIPSFIDGSVVNNGSIVGTQGNGAYGIRVNDTTITGELINTGTITAGVGVNVGYGSALLNGISNSGSISSIGHAMRLTGGLTHGVLNTGVIESSTDDAFIVETTTIVGNILNTVAGSNVGTIRGRTGLRIGDVNGTGASTSAYENRGATVTGSIVNSGLIEGTAGAGISVIGSLVVGNISNSSTGTIIGGLRIVSGLTGATTSTVQSIASSVGGSVVNSGLITVAGGAAGIFLDESVVQGSIRNAGTINSGSGTGILLGRNSSVGGGITNSGTIYGQQGIVLGMFSASGLVPPRGNNTVTGGIVNEGLISVSGAAIISYGSSIGTNTYASMVNGGVTNSGTIFGAYGIAFGYHDSISGSIVNQGVISVTGNGEAIALNGTDIDGSIINTGSIVSLSIAPVISIRSSSITGLISNAGIISALMGPSTYAIQVTNGSTISGGIQNSGTIIGGVNIGVADVSQGITNAGLMQVGESGIFSSATSLNVVNQVGASIIGAVNGSLDLTNSGLLALQTVSGGTIVGGSHVNASILGNYVQGSTGTLSIGVNGTSGTGTIAGNYSQLTVGGIASLVGGTVNVSMNNDSAVASGGTLAGVVTSTSNQLTATGLSVTDNSALVNFVYTTTAGVMDLVAVANNNYCGATISGTQQGPCEVAFDNQTITVLAGGSIGGAANGIKVLTGTITAGGIVNAGTVMGSVNAIEFLAGSTFTGNVSNSGLIQGAVGLLVNSTVNGTIINAVGGVIAGSNGVGILIGGSASLTSIENAGNINSINNAGALSSVDNSGSLGNLFNSGSISSLANSGSLTNVNNSGTLSSLAQAAGNLTSVTNSGLINGVTAVGVTGGVLSSLTNSGSISGSGVGVAISAGATLMGMSNQGSVNSINNAGALSSVDNSGSLGNLFNSGSISSLANSGVITNLLNTGLMQNLTNINGQIVNGVTNSGLITGVNGAAVTASGTAITLNNTTGTIVGEVSGSLNITNSGLLALQTVSGGTIVGGSHVNASILGNYVQGSTGTLSIGVNGISGTGTIAGNYSQLTVGGIASLVGGTVNVSMNNDSAVARGGVLSNIVSANGLTATGLSITDNSALIRFDYSTTTGTLSLQAIGVDVCGSTVSGSRVGPCEVAFDAPSVYIASSGSIGGAATGIKVLTGAITAGGIVNAGTVMGSVNAIEFLAGSTFTGNVSNSGLIQGAVGLLVNSTVNGTIINAVGGVISGTGASGIAIQSGSVNSITNSGLIAGSANAISVSGAATLNNIVITGNNTASFSGDVVAPNTPVTVVGGATYTLNSTFEVSNFTNQGTLVTPVASVATPTITGNLTLQNGGTFNPTVLSPSSYSQVDVGGTAALGGALAISAAGATNLTRGGVLSGVIRASSVTGAFAAITDDHALYNFLAVNNGNSVGLQVVQVGGNFIAAAAQANGNKAGHGAAQALDNIAMAQTMTAVTNVLGVMPNDTQISNAVSQTLPVMSGATVWNTMSVLTGINRIIEARHLKNKGISSGEDFTGSNALWMKPFGTWTNQANQNGAYGFKANTGGLMFGGDTLVSKDMRLGGGFAWGNSYATSNAGAAPQSQTSNMYQFIGYGSYGLTDTLEANFQANGGWNSNSSNRQIGFMGTSAQGNYSSAVWHVGAGLSNPYNVTDSTQLIPSARFDYTWIKNQGYSETGASNGLGLNVNAETYQTSILGVDGKVVQKLSDHNSVNANVGVGYNFSPTQTWVAAAFQGSPNLQFTTNGVNPGAVMGRAGAGYTYKVKENVDVGIRYDIDFQSSYTNQTATAKARWMF